MNQVYENMPEVYFIFWFFTMMAMIQGKETKGKFLLSTSSANVH